jgi:hypothetical protein
MEDVKGKMEYVKHMSRFPVTCAAAGRQIVLKNRFSKFNHTETQKEFCFTKFLTLCFYVVEKTFMALLTKLYNVPLSEVEGLCAATCSLCS